MISSSKGSSFDGNPWASPVKQWKIVTSQFHMLNFLNCTADQPLPADKGDLYKFPDGNANVAYSALVDLALQFLQKQNY